MAEKPSDFFRGNPSTIILRKNAEQTEKIYDELIKSRLSKEEEAAKIRAKQESNLLEQLASLSKQADKEEYNSVLKQLRALDRQNTAYEKKKAEQHKRAVELATAYEQSRYESLSKHEQMQYQLESKARLEQKSKELAEIEAAERGVLERLKAAQEAATTKAEKNRLGKEIAKQEVVVDNVSAAASENSAQLNEVTQLSETLIKNFATPLEKAKILAEDYAKKEQARSEALMESESAHQALAMAIANGADEDVINKLQAEADAKRKAAEETTKAAQSALDQKQANEELAKSYETLEEQQKKEEEKQKKKADLVNKAADLVNNQIETRLKSLYGQQSRMQSRLQGSGNSDLLDWSGLVTKVNFAVGISPLVSQQKIVEQMTKLIDSGVAYNVELRAFLAEMSENIASTFSAFDANLLRLIRLQQADTTAARLGMEASLTKLFNQYFSDTSYLSDAADTVSGALLEASSLMHKNDSVAFEYTVQKWLGALYSLGMSTSGVQQIATGLNYLGTGDYSALGNNTPLQSLLVLSANRAGLSYTSLLEQGATAEETNKLLRSMVEYLAEIAESQETNVTKSAYATLFGMSISDFSSFTSLKESEINDIFASNQTYDTLMAETSKQVYSSFMRLSTQQIIDNVIDNAFTGSAQLIGSNAVTYGLWKALSLVESLAELEIPGIQAMGTGTASGIKIFSVAKLGMAGLGLLGSLLGALVNTASSGGDLFSKWGFDEYTPRGSSLSVLSNGSQSATSLSGELGVGSASAEDVEATSLKSAQEKGTDALEQIQNEELQDVSGMEERIWNTLEDEEGNTVIKLLKGMAAATSPGDTGGTPSDNLDVSGSSSTPSDTGGESGSSSGGGGSSSSGSSGGGSLSNAIQDSEIYNKIYDAIAEGESVNVLTVLQEISDKLALDRVFYTGITSSTSGAISGSIQDMSSHIHHSHFHDFSMSAGVTSTDKESSDSNVVSKGELLNKQYSENMQEIIATAVEIAIRNISGYSTGTGLPVTVTNLNNYGGGF